VKPPLLLNHSFLEGLAHHGTDDGDEEARKAARRPLVEVAETVQRARRTRRTDAILYVHHDLTSAEVAGQPFIQWANQHRRDIAWGEALNLLLQLLSGPFVNTLPVDEGACPTDTEPSCLQAPPWLVEMLLTAAHHGLAFGLSSWILSYGPEPHIHEPVYLAGRDERAIELHNFRTDEEARNGEVALSLQDAQTTLSILDAAIPYTERVRVLDTARSSAKRWDLDCKPERLFEAICGLDAYARALDEGLSRELAADRYKLACGIEMSQEKAQTLKKPSVREQRKFLIPGDTEKGLFDMHAKPGSKTRIHVLARDEGRDTSGAEKRRHTVVYIGHCGEHLDLK